MSLVIDWDGENLPPALESLPPGRYVVERIDESTALTEAEEEGIRQALASLDAGKALSSDEVRTKVLGPLGSR